MFTDDEKRIFQYALNGETLYADPLRIKRLLQIGTNGQFDQLVEQQREGGEVEQAEANGILAQATAAAFRFPLLDPKTGSGFTEGESIDLLRRFLEWIEQKKTTGETLSTSST